MQRGGGTFTYAYQYNSSGLLSSLTYPSTLGTPLQLNYAYSNGMLQSITDVSDSPTTTIWTADAANPAGQMTQETLGNGVQINRSFNPATLWLNAITAGVSGGAALENQDYEYDAVGNVTQRQENNLGLTENFNYDDVNRLSGSQLVSPSGSGTNLQVCYDNSGGGCAQDQKGPGYVTAKSAEATAPVNYNATWTSYNYPASIATDTESVQFSYGPSRQRWQQNYNSGAEVTNYIGGLLEQVVTPSGTTYRHYVYAGAEPVAIQSRSSSGNTWTYMLSDHQGSVASLLNASGGTAVNESFTAYGARRDPSTWSGAASSADLIASAALTRQGYTFQTALGQSMGLNHMNGRVQDAITGQFLSPDPIIQDPTNTQNYDRYAYVVNNPVTFTDPSGHDFCPGLAEAEMQNALQDIAIDETDDFQGNDGQEMNGTLPLLTVSGTSFTCYPTGSPDGGSTGSPDGTPPGWPEGNPPAQPGSPFPPPGGPSTGGSSTGPGGPTGSPPAPPAQQSIQTQLNRPQTQQKPPKPFSAYVCARTGTQCEETPPPPTTTCPNGQSPTRSNNPSLANNAGLGLLGGAAVAATVVAINIVGFPEAEGAEGAGLLVGATEVFHPAVAGVYATGYGGTLGTGIGVLATTPTCPTQSLTGP